MGRKKILGENEKNEEDDGRYFFLRVWRIFPASDSNMFTLM